MPDEVLGGSPEPNDSQVAAANAAAASATATPETTPVSQDLSPAAVSTQPAAPASTSTTPTAAQQAFSAREYIRSRGGDPSQFGSDQEVMDYLIGQIQQAQPLVNYGRQYSQYAAEFEKWRADQARATEQARQVQQPQGKPGWKAPEYDPVWQHQTIFDPGSNTWVSKQGVDPAIGRKYTEFRRHAAEFQDKFAQNPGETLREQIAQIAQEQAQRLVDAKLASYQTNTYISSFERQNASWIYQHDQNGNVMRDMAGEPLFSNWGRKFYGYIEQANQYGIRDPQAKEAYARQLLSAEYAMQQARTPVQPAALTNEQQKQALLVQGRQPNHSGTTAPASNPVLGVPAQNVKLTLREQLAKNLRDAGITDEQIANEMSR